jgi:hypothetical protein
MLNKIYKSKKRRKTKLKSLHLNLIKKFCKMKVTTEGHTATIHESKYDLGELIAKLTYEIESYKEQNLIVDLTHYGVIQEKHLIFFKTLSMTHKQNKKSFVLVVSSTDFDAFPENFVVVPSLLEANDIIAMEEIERDLGF